MAALAPLVPAYGQVVRSVVQTDLHTGRLVRKTVAEPHSAPAPATFQAASQNLTELIDAIALKNDVEAPLVHSVIQTESNYNPLAVSNKGAQGLMQLIPSTARRFGVKDSFDMRENVEGGTRYLKYLITLFHGDYSLAVAAYNAGEAAVTKYGGVPPFKETRGYVRQVSQRLEARRRSAPAPNASGANAEPVALAETEHPVIASVLPDGRVLYRTP